jgi:hypothetical protein
MGSVPAGLGGCVPPECCLGARLPSDAADLIVSPRNARRLWALAGLSSDHAWLGTADGKLARITTGRTAMIVSADRADT